MFTDDTLGGGATRQTLVPGARLFGRYVLTRLIGSGRKGDVWMAKDERLAMTVAIKFLVNYPHFAALKQHIGGLLALTHPNIVRIFDFGGDESLCGFVMEYFESRPLSDLLRERNGTPFTVEEVQKWTRELFSALEFASRAGDRVHKDIRLANLLIGPTGTLKVSEFGLAPVRRFVADAPQGDTEFFSLPALSPQIIDGEEPTVQDDLYAAGAAVYELLTGKPVFPGGNIVVQIRQKVPPSVAERRAEFGHKPSPVPKAWEGWIARCLAKQRADRPASAAEVLSVLDGTQTATTQTKVIASVTQAVGGTLGRLQPAFTALSWKSAAALVAGVGVVGLAFYGFFWQPRKRTLELMRQDVAMIEAREAAAGGKTPEQLGELVKAWDGWRQAHGRESVAFTEEDEALQQRATTRSATLTAERDAMIKEKRRLEEEADEAAVKLRKQITLETGKDAEAAPEAAPERLRAWQKLAESHNLDAHAGHEAFESRAEEARKKIAIWQEKAKAQEDAARQWIEARRTAWGGVEAFCANVERGAEAKVKRAKDFALTLAERPQLVAADDANALMTKALAAQTEWVGRVAGEKPQATLAFADVFADTQHTALPESERQALLKKAQAKLKELGYLTSAPDGKWGAGTQKAVIAWQTKEELVPSGKFTDASLVQLIGDQTPPALVAPVQVDDTAPKTSADAEEEKPDAEPTPTSPSPPTPKKTVAKTPPKKKPTTPRKWTVPEEPSAGRKILEGVKDVGKGIGQGAKNIFKKVTGK